MTSKHKSEDYKLSADAAPKIDEMPPLRGGI